MNAAEYFLCMPARYAARLGNIRWSAHGDALEDDAGFLAFVPEFVGFTEGFGARRPLIHLGHLVHLMSLLRRGPWYTDRGPLKDLVTAFQKEGRDNRNAGAFAAVLCRDLPPAPRVPSPRAVWECLEVGNTAVGLPAWLAGGTSGEEPPIPAHHFEIVLAEALQKWEPEEIRHWLRHGGRPVQAPGQQLARAVPPPPPRTLAGVLADLSRRERLSGAVPFVSQLVGALSLPPRRLGTNALPVGGYADVTTRGTPERLLPGQFALDGLEFARRHAQGELLYFQREDPTARRREELVVLLDQGVRTWGVVRLVLTAALMALGKQAESRRLPFRLAVTSTGGTHDPFSLEPDALGKLLEASDLSTDPGLALERLLEEQTTAERDFLLLTHPRTLISEGVVGAAQRWKPPARLFAVTVDDTGAVQWGEWRRGFVPRGHCRINLEAPAPAPRPTVAVSRGDWSGDVEPVGFPFRFGIGSSTMAPFLLFDDPGEWVLATSEEGLYVVIQVNGRKGMLLPRPWSPTLGLFTRDRLGCGVAGGFVLVGHAGKRFLLAHYDLQNRTCKLIDIGPLRRDFILTLRYHRNLHTVLVSDPTRQLAIDLADCTTATSPGEGGRAGQALHLVPPSLSPADRVVGFLNRPGGAQVEADGLVCVIDGMGGSLAFTPLADGVPVLKGTTLKTASYQGNSLVLGVQDSGQNTNRIYLFGLPQGVLLGEAMPAYRHHYCLSADGRFLAQAIPNGRVRVRETVAGARWRALPDGRFHSDTSIALGRSCLVIKSSNRKRLVRWDGRFLTVSLSSSNEQLPGALIFPSGSLPNFLGYDRRRFVCAARGALTAVLDLYGQVVVFDKDGALICMFFAFREKVAAWAPDGTCLGPWELLGRYESPQAAEKLAEALKQAEQRGEKTRP